MAIKVTGFLELRENFEVELNMSKEEFLALDDGRKVEIISEYINWNSWGDSAEVTDYCIWDDDIENVQQEDN